MKKLLSILGASVITTSGVAPLMAMSQYEPNNLT
ncbi:lipoprotein [Spiroplasma sp. ChiS]|nr:lipoprotein [Spiroplasma sp. ChiS]